MSDQSASSLERCREIVRRLVDEHGLDQAEVSVLARALTPQEAIGTPGRRDFPVIEGKERVIEATVLGARGQAFTDSPCEFRGQLAQVLELPFNSNQHRALFIATLNATARHLHLVEDTVHCRDEAPEQCALEIAKQLRTMGSPSLGLVGLNPALAEALVGELGAEAVRITDLNPQNIGQTRFGVEVWDGKTRWQELIDRSETVLVTGTTLVNASFDALQRGAESAGRRFIVYGVTAAAVCRLLGMARLCPCAQS